MSEKPLQGFIDECEREQLHLTRFIQPSGLLLAGTAGDARIRHLSANAAEWLGRQPETLLGQALTDCFPEFPPDTTASDQAVRWMYPSADKQLFPGLCSGPAGLLDGWLSCNDNNWLLELEPALPESQRLAAYRPIPHRLFRMPSSESEWTRYGQFLADTLREATGFERVMIYRFRDDDSGEVITESLEPGLEPYLGLRYPASDIPQTARDLYLANSHRQIPDRRAEPVAILSETGPGETRSPLLDLSLSDLRAVSPVHLEYLKNMDVTASLSFSIVVGERLWGLIACHHREPRDLPLPLRERCVAMCQALSLAISGFQGAQRLLELSASEEYITRLHETMRQSDEDYARGHETDATPALGKLLLELVGASGAALVDGNSFTSFAQVPEPAAIRAQVAWLLEQSEEHIFATNHLPELFPPARAYVDRASGLLAVRVRHFSDPGERLFLWWRPEQPQTVTWAGDPRKSALSDQGQQMLSPRASFEHWVETTTGHSEPWSSSDLLRARKFRSLLLRDINADLLSP
ncbi:GAF domain-containing protein [Thiorhodovibrio frisius]|uniref:Bacteriophytochrome (Light-regulated signal transduction histidine kinase) n=1 Tax=Thiorhodovibrio frisius TaxID=631362 RepID=H8Z584_9GAMM|nr:GAF domain-containing protein [Thiorhodovibrio frisius]EIC20491.1 bacteriophytochrome (light-regulated signal transduction histidine kinase) [Thiorhodovibrio frisius]WPL21232.1 Phytochrome-like protein cph1 [Thiorhodovibrio frisius]